MKVIVIFLLLSITALGYNQELGARNFALGKNYLTHSDIISASANLSKLVKIESFSAGLSTKNTFFLPEFQESLFCIGLPLFKGFFSFRYAQYGYGLYHQSNISLNYAISVSPSFSVGIALLCNILSIAEENTLATSFYPNLGLNYQLNESLELGILLSNLSLSKITKNSTILWPVKADLGLSYSINPKVKFLLIYLVSLNEQNAMGCGIEYALNSTFSLQTGVSSNPMLFSIGTGIKLNKISIDLASSYQAFLGISPSISIRFESMD